MQEALNYFYYFFDKAVSFVFNDLAFFSGVTFGWVMVVVFVFGVLLRNVVALPSKAPVVHLNRKDNDNG